MIDKELLNANASLAVMPNTETNYEEAIVFLEGYLKNGIIPKFRGFLEQLKQKIPLLYNGIFCFGMLDFSYYG
jgi:hypothetical protein